MTAEDRETEQPSLSMSMFASIEDYLRAMLDAERVRADAAERDARRWRWLRDDSEWEPFDSAWLCRNDLYGQGGADLDAWTDAAISAATEGVQHGEAK